MTALAPRVEPLRVVLVDDTVDLRDLLRMALTRAGLEVVGEAGDGRAGIEVVRAEDPDLVLLDLSMPVMDGLEALPAIRRSMPEGKIVVLSGFGASQMSQQALALGADGYLQKGMSIKRILDYVRTITDDLRHDLPRAERLATPPPPALTLVPPVPEPEPEAEPELEAETEPERRGEPDLRWAEPVPFDDSARAVLRSPYGVVWVAVEPDLRLLSVNPAAAQVLGDRACPGTSLTAVAPALAAVLLRSALTGRIDDEVLETEVGGREVRVTVRREADSLLLFLDAPTGMSDMLRRAIATTAHEIRGPVTVLCSVAEMLRIDDGLDQDSLRRMMASVDRQARALDSITRDLLTASQMQRATLRLEVEDVRPEQVVDAVVAERSLEEVVVRVDDDRDVRVDPVRLEQMLGNLLTNAMKYGRAPYRVVIRRHESDATAVSIDVVDAGDGVPPDFRDRLFDEFTRCPGSTPAPGTGLGLYVVRSLAEAHGGSVDYAAAPAGGSVFTVTLPAS